MSQYVFGKNSVVTLLETNPQRVFKLFLLEQQKPDKRLQRIYDLAHAHKIPVQKVARQKLEQMVGDTEQPATHQGVVASVAPKKLLDLRELITKCKEQMAAGQTPNILVLDGITDPRNFGAILRIADGAGLAGVVVPKNRSAGFGPAVAKTASGAEETVDVVVVGNLAQALEGLKEAGFWCVGTDASEKAQAYDRLDYNMPVALLMGSEGEGLSRLLKERCDFLVKIPMHGAVDSLNVSVATGILVYEVLRQQRLKSG